MVSLQKVPIVEVNKDNLVQLWPAMVLAIKSSTFISLDTVSIACYCILYSNVCIFCHPCIVVYT